MSYKFVKNKNYGYWEVEPKPGIEELRKYYEDKYYQDEKATYSHSYSEEEKKYFFNKISQKAFIINKLLGTDKFSLLDIGCGEGFTLDYFYKAGCEVCGIDFSDFAIRAMHPHLTPYFLHGNIWDTIESLISQQKTYGVIWLDNVLEHVVDPGELLRKAMLLTKPGGVLIIEVPNDYSLLQHALFERNKVNRKYWEAYPDHLVYFGRESLISLCENTGWRTERVISDFPIEWFLMNDHSNYCNDRSLGKQAHGSRIFLENLLNDQVPDKDELMNFYESMSKIGQGRQLIGFFKKE